MIFFASKVVPSQDLVELGIGLCFGSDVGVLNWVREKCNLDIGAGEYEQL